MTFDDGILRVFEKRNISSDGNMPKYKLMFQQTLYFGFDVLGFNRYYTALQANKRIDMVINIPGWENFDVNSIVILEDNLQYTLQMVQRMYDEENLKYTKLSLERLGESYAIWP